MSEQINPPRFVTCCCQHCKGNIEFDANQLEGTTRAVNCPHCGLETKLFIPPTVHHSPRFVVLVLLAVLSIAAIFIFKTRHEVEQKKIEEKNFQDLMNPERDPKFRVNDIIETVQEDSAAEIKNDAWLDKELSKNKEGSDIVDEANEVLRRRMMQQIASETNTSDIESRLTKQDIEQINLWEKRMEQKVLETAVESEKHGANTEAVEDAIVLTLQLKQQSQ
jgi:hypothetical protein